MIENLFIKRFQEGILERNHLLKAILTIVLAALKKFSLFQVFFLCTAFSLALKSQLWQKEKFSYHFLLVSQNTYETLLMFSNEAKPTNNFKFCSF